MKTVQQEWEGFWEMVKPKSPSVTQMREMKKAFFSGAFVAFTQVEVASHTITPETEAEACEHMDACYRETKAFHREMIRQYAEGN